MKSLDLGQEDSKHTESPSGKDAAIVGDAIPSLKEFRHKAEIPMLILGTVLTLLAAAVCVYFIVLGETLSDFGTGVLIGLAAPLILFFGIRWSYWNTITNAVEVTSTQFPEVYEIYQELARKMGFAADSEDVMRIPRLYIVNGNGVMNAFASKCQVRRGYVVMHSDIIDVGYIHNDWDFIRFVLAHELGHIKCGHVDLWRSMIRPVTTALLLEPSVIRAQEYTADRVASYFVPHGSMGMIHLYCGKHLGHKVDLNEYFESVSNHRNGLWTRIANFFSSHAVGFRRMVALREAETKGWDVHGKML